MIPKVIHYCWFGPNPLPKKAQKCIKSWQAFAPDFELKLWNEETFDVKMFEFTKVAYEEKKFAFVSDVVRLYALYYYGGIYMDTDVELIGTLEPFLNHEAFSGMELNQPYAVTGIIGARKTHPWIEKLLEPYYELSFKCENDKTYNVPNTITITKITKKLFNFNPEVEINILKDGLVIYPGDYFCAKDWRNGRIYRTSNTVSIHHFAGSWFEKKPKSLKYYVKRFFGQGFVNRLSRLKQRFRRKK